MEAKPCARKDCPGVVAPHKEQHKFCSALCCALFYELRSCERRIVKCSDVERLQLLQAELSALQELSLWASQWRANFEVRLGLVTS